MNQETFKRVKELIVRLSREMGSMIFTRSQEQLDEKGINDTGLLKKSGDIIITSDGMVIIYSAKHAKWIEFGTPPHAVSEEGYRKIVEWARRKLQAEDPEAAAWAIKAKIAKEGSEPKHFLRDGIDLGKDDFKKKYDGKTIRI